MRTPLAMARQQRQLRGQPRCCGGLWGPRARQQRAWQPGWPVTPRVTRRGDWGIWRNEKAPRGVELDQSCPAGGGGQESKCHGCACPWLLLVENAVMLSSMLGTKLLPVLESLHLFPNASLLGQVGILAHRLLRFFLILTKTKCD